MTIITKNRDWLVRLAKAMPPHLPESGRERGAGLLKRTKWATEADAAMNATFPASHSISKQWGLALKSIHDYGAVFNAGGVLEAAITLIDEGHLATVVDGVRADTVTELLELAESFLDVPVAAMVIAGGAMETHLRHLCDRHGLQVEGHGNISKYTGKMSQHANTGAQVEWTKTDISLCTGWGQMRNDAAHKPGEFTATTAEVRTAIDGIKQFVARTI